MKNSWAHLKALFGGKKTYGSKDMELVMKDVDAQIGRAITRLSGR